MVYNTTGYNFTFKYPNADDGEIVSEDVNYSYIISFFYSLEEVMTNIAEASEGVSTKVDYVSFAKWYLIHELIQNWEPNRFYVLPSKTCKLKMYPAWDAEWSMGLAKKGNPDNPWGWYFPPVEPDFDVCSVTDRYYFQWLFKDPAFVETLKNECMSLKPQLSEVILNINKKLF